MISHKDIYDQVFDIIDTHASFTGVFETKQRGFYPRDPDNIVPTLFPWIFIEYGGCSAMDVHRAPRQWEHDFTVNVVIMTFADRGHPTDLVFSESENINPGIGDLADTIRNVFWENYKQTFGVDGVIDWNITRIGTPSVLSVQRWLMNPYMRGIQLDLTFRTKDTLSL